MSAKYTVGHYLVDRLSQLGLEHLFSIAGDYTIEWVNGYVEPSNIRVIEEVNEVNAGYAADGYARMKGIGALCLTYSAGALCAVNALAGAYVEKVPVVLINGAPNINRTIRFEQTGFSAHHFINRSDTDLQIFRHITAAAVRIDHPGLAPMLIDTALTKCITERRPVYIELLQDMVDLECERPQGQLKPLKPSSDTDDLKKSVAQIGEKLKTAVKPLVWVGIEVDRFGLQRKTESLLQQLNIPYVTELLSKSALSEADPLFVGVFDGQASSAAVFDMVKDADFILALGVWLTDINSLGSDPDYAKTAFVSLDAVRYGVDFYPHIALEDLIDGLLGLNVRGNAQAVPPRPQYKAPDVKPTDQITYQGLYDFIPRYVDENTIVGSDASLNYFGSILLKVPAQGGFIAQSSYSSIGYISAAATGMCLARKNNERVIVLTGDGGFQMTAQCLSTQTRFKLNPIIIVIDNGVYGVEQWLADASVFITGKPFYKSCELHRWNYSDLGPVFGCLGRKVSTYGGLENAMDDALKNSSSPSIIQVVVPDKSIPGNAEWKAKHDLAPGPA